MAIGVNAMALEGRVLGHGLASDGRGRTVAYRVRDLTQGPNNGVILARQGKRWHSEVQVLGAMKAGTLDYEVFERCWFAEEVFLTVAMNIDQGVCCNLAAQATDCGVLGVMTYHHLTYPPDAWSVGLLAVEPFNQAGTPGKNQLRGVGTGMVAALARAILGRGATSLTLSPLDDAARTFWLRRGFHPCSSEPYATKLCLSSPAEIRRLIQVCDELPDCPADGDCVACGVRKGTTVRAMYLYRVPGRGIFRSSRVAEMVNNGQGWKTMQRIERSAAAVEYMPDPETKDRVRVWRADTQTWEES